MKQNLSHLLCALSLATCISFPCLAQRQTTKFSWTSTDVRYEQQPLTPLHKTASDTTITVWRGERLSVQALLQQVEGEGTYRLRMTPWRGKSATVPARQGSAHFLNYVLTDNYQACGYHPNNLTPFSVPDIVSNDSLHHLKATQQQPVWCILEVPQHLQAGLYTTQFQLTDSLGKKVLKQLTLRLRVLNRTLPTPQEQAFHVDFWQQPYAVSRYYGVKRWSEAHFKLLRPYIELLARSGQKVISTILFYEPWGDQSHDKFDPMVQTVRRADGTWSFDYTIFDRWVSLCDSCGISKQISCYSMVPWDMSFRYFDEAKGQQIDLKTTTSSDEYRQLWTAFLKDFAAHLRQKGWFDRTCIAMDERGLPNMLDAYKVAQEAVPGIRMALAGNYHEELVDKLQDYCIAYGQYFTVDQLKARRAKGQVSTTYTCCSSAEPNLFSNSLPAEATYLPLYCYANHFDGYLHWSWMNWADKPLTDSRFRLFAPGDTYLIYPGPATSVRYERFIEGVTLVEKARQIAQEYEKQGNVQTAQRLGEVLKTFSPERPEVPYSELIQQLRQLVNQ